MGASVHGRWLVPMVMAGCLLAGGCKGSGDGAAGSASAPATTRSAEDQEPPQDSGCPVGTYAVTDLDATAAVEVDGAQVTLSDGGGMTITLTRDGAWTLSADGSEPVTAERHRGGQAGDGHCHGRRRFARQLRQIR